jgi:ferric-dicitrate binding protein FerR (iron transport regulator)
MNNEMKNIEKFTDKEWEELASILSDEKNEHPDLISRFNDGDTGNSAKQWKDLRIMSSNEEINVDRAWNNVHSRLIQNNLVEAESPVRIRFMRSTFMKIAAVALVLVSLGAIGLYMNKAGYLSKQISVVAANDQKNVLVSLPDGSKVYLNRNSEFTYKSNFGKNGRDVKLTGEAFFEIAPDATKPFIIDAGKAKVRVVGTTFNVITNNNESAVEVFVKTGKVLVSDESGSQSIQLDPGYVGVMNSIKSDKKVNNDPNYISWKTNYLYYNGQQLSVVFNDLKRVYNMNIVADDPSILENPWNSPIDNVSQETIIRVICNTFNLSSTKDGDVYHLTKK